MIWDKFSRPFCFRDEEDSGLSDKEQKQKVAIKRGQGKRACHAEREKLMQMAGKSPKAHTKTNTSSEENFLWNFKTVSKMAKINPPAAFFP